MLRCYNNGKFLEKLEERVIMAIFFRIMGRGYNEGKFLEKREVGIIMAIF